VRGERLIVYSFVKEKENKKGLLFLRKYLETQKFLGKGGSYPYPLPYHKRDDNSDRKEKKKVRFQKKGIDSGKNRKGKPVEERGGRGGEMVEFLGGLREEKQARPSSCQEKKARLGKKGQKKKRQFDRREKGKKDSSFFLIVRGRERRVSQFKEKRGTEMSSLRKKIRRGGGPGGKFSGREGNAPDLTNGGRCTEKKKDSSRC